MQKKMSVIVSVLLIHLLSITLIFAQTKKITPLGKYDFYHYYNHDELTNYLKDINKAFPKLTELRSMCKSQMGRDVWMLVIQNPKTGEEFLPPKGSCWRANKETINKWISENRIFLVRMVKGHLN